MQRYPEGINVTVEDFRSSNWSATVDASHKEGYSSMWQSLSTAASSAVESGRFSEGKALWLLADACSMMLKPDSLNEPFKPYIEWSDGRRSVIPEDFEPSDVELFSSIVEEIDNIWLKARLADLVWLLQRPRNPKYPLLAIDAYREIPLTLETWIRDGRECWQRAIVLTKMLRAGAGDRILEIESGIINAFESSTKEDNFFALFLSEMLMDHRLGQDNSVNIAEKLQLLARAFDDEGEWRKAREYFAGSAAWFKKANDNASAAEMIVCEAEEWVKEAEGRLSSEQPSYIAAASFYENAIQTYRTIPRGERATHRVDERIAELYRRMNDAGERSIGEMRVISSGPIDISEIAEDARSKVRGKSNADALLAFANIYGGAEKTKIQSFSERMLQAHPLRTLFSATHMSSNGRVVAKQPGVGPSEPASDEYQAAIWAEMVKNYSLEISIVVHGSIWPALEILLLEHRLVERDFVFLASASPIVLKDRERLFGKALFAGYEQDFVTALHLLVPQIEHTVRSHLKNAGVKTTTLDSRGVENENGLSTLVDLPEVDQIFGENLAFEFKALFCDAFGPNLRNALAHGLLDDEASHSVHSVYAWWLGMRLVFNTFWNSRRADAESTSSESHAS